MKNYLNPDVILTLLSYVFNLIVVLCSYDKGTYCGLGHLIDVCNISTE